MSEKNNQDIFAVAGNILTVIFDEAGPHRVELNGELVNGLTDLAVGVAAEDMICFATFKSIVHCTYEKRKIVTATERA